MAQQNAHTKAHRPLPAQTAQHQPRASAAAAGKPSLPTLSLTEGTEQPPHPTTDAHTSLPSAVNAPPPAGTQPPAAKKPLTPNSLQRAHGGDTAKIAALSAPIRNTTISQFQRFFVSLNNLGMGKERSRFIENLGILLNSGLSVIDALRTIQAELKNKAMRKINQRIIEEVESGIALWRAMDNRCFFSTYALALIRIGEEAGSLSKNMEYLAEQQDKDHALRSKVKMAMIYPSIVVLLTMIITLGLAWFVLPQLVTVLLSLNAKLPLSTRIIIWVANFFQAHGAVVVPLIAAATLLLFLVAKYTPLKGTAQQIIFKIPGVGTMARSATIASFGIIMGSLLKAGVPIVESMRSLADVTDVVQYKHFYCRLAREIEAGQSFSVAFSTLKESRRALPISVQQLIVTGERSGRMPDMLLRIAAIYEKKAEEAATRLPVVLEPLLLIFIGGLVGTIAFSIIVPIYSIVGSVGR